MSQSQLTDSSDLDMPQQLLSQKSGRYHAHITKAAGTDIHSPPRLITVNGRELDGVESASQPTAANGSWNNTDRNGRRNAISNDQPNPWHIVRKSNRASSGCRSWPVPAGAPNVNPRITLAVISKLSEFTGDHASSLLDYLRWLLMKRYDDKELLDEEDWKHVQLRFAPSLNTRKTLVYMHFENFLKEQTNLGRNEAPQMNRYTNFVLYGRGLPEEFERTGLSLPNFVSNYSQGLKSLAHVPLNDPLHSVLSLLAQDIYLRDVQPIWRGWPHGEDCSSDEQEISENESDTGPGAWTHGKPHPVIKEEVAASGWVEDRRMGQIRSTPNNGVQTVMDNENDEEDGNTSSWYEESTDDESEYVDYQEQVAALTSSDSDDERQQLYSKDDGSEVTGTGSSLDEANSSDGVHDDSSYEPDSAGFADSEAETTILTPLKRQRRASPRQDSPPIPTSAATEVPESWGEMGMCKRPETTRRLRGVDGRSLAALEKKHEAVEHRKQRYPMPTVSGPGFENYYCTPKRRKAICSAAESTSQHSIESGAKTGRHKPANAEDHSTKDLISDDGSSSEIRRAGQIIPRLLTPADSVDGTAKVTTPSTDSSAAVSSRVDLNARMATPSKSVTGTQEMETDVNQEPLKLTANVDSQAPIDNIKLGSDFLSSIYAPFYDRLKLNRAPLQEDSSDSDPDTQFSDQRAQNRSGAYQDVRNCNDKVTSTETDTESEVTLRSIADKMQRVPSSMMENNLSVHHQAHGDTMPEKLYLPELKGASAQMKTVSYSSMFDSKPIMTSVESKIRPDLANTPSLLKKSRIRPLPDLGKIMEAKFRKSQAVRKRVFINEDHKREEKELFVKKRRLAPSPTSCIRPGNIESIQPKATPTSESIEIAAKDPASNAGEDMRRDSVMTSINQVCEATKQDTANGSKPKRVWTLSEYANARRVVDAAAEVAEKKQAASVFNATAQISKKSCSHLVNEDSKLVLSRNMDEKKQGAMIQQKAPAINVLSDADAVFPKWRKPTKTAAEFSDGLVKRYVMGRKNNAVSTQVGLDYQGFDLWVCSSGSRRGCTCSNSCSGLGKEI